MEIKKINAAGLAWSSSVVVLYLYLYLYLYLSLFENQCSRLGLVFICGGLVNISASDAKRKIPRWASTVLLDIIDMLSFAADLKFGPNCDLEVDNLEKKLKIWRGEAGAWILLIC